MATPLAGRSFFATFGLVFLAIAGLFVADTFLARTDRVESQIEAQRLFVQGQALMQRGENKEAVDRINADFYRYAHHVAAHAKGALAPTELLRAFVRYKHVDYYDPALFNRAYDWMKARGLSEGQSQHAALVVG